MAGASLGMTDRALREPVSSLDALSRALRCLPGVGPKAAQRMALHLMQHDRDGARALGQALMHAADTIRHCERCNTFTEETICALCRSPRRDPSLLCVVETPADLLMVEHATGRQLLLAFEVGAPAESSLAATEKRERAEASAKREAAFRDEPFVRDLLAKFDGQVRSDTIKPNDVSG